MPETKKTWLAAYLYRGEPWEDFLTGTVMPFVDDVFEKKLADQFFFIRYWERGPHMRLRFKGDTGVLEEKVKPQLDDHFNNYFKQHPSERKEFEDMEKLPPEQQWFPNDSVQYIEYEPEVERYGGPVGILVAEKQFEISSRAVSAVIEECDTWDYDRALGAAIQLHLGFAFAMGMNLMETAAFYSRIFNVWFSRAYGYTPDTPAEEIKNRQEITMKAFEENFARQESTLVPYHRTIWDAFTEGAFFEQEWLNRWLDGMAGIKEELKTIQRQKKLVIPTWFKQERLEDIPEENQDLWAILESYVHMTNNRLGILNRDEAYLGYLIKESLNKM
jgi:thiopeptide-type bacteriocin biosynthesis protein